MTSGARATAFAAAIGMALGAIPLYFGGSMLYERIAYGSAGSPASAEVVEAERLWLRDFTTPFRNREVWRVTYEFKTAKGDVLRSAGTYLQHSAMADPSAGLKVRVLYLADDPASSYLEDAYKTWDGLWYLGLGLFVWFVTSAFVWWEIRQARDKAR